MLSLTAEVTFFVTGVSQGHFISLFKMMAFVHMKYCGPYLCLQSAEGFFCHLIVILRFMPPSRGLRRFLRRL